MTEIASQLINGVLIPYSDEDKEALSEYYQNQILTLKVSGVEKPRSYDQLKLYFGCCDTVALNTEDPEWNSKEKVHFKVRCILRFYKSVSVQDDKVMFELKSISYRDMKHRAACNYVEKAFGVMADFLGITVEQLIEETKKRIGNAL